MPPVSAPISLLRYGPAPVVEVSGRTFPVEVRWQPPLADEDGEEADLQQAVLAAVEEVSAIDQGDILIFMPTERHIHETAKTLRGRPLPGDPAGRSDRDLAACMPDFRCASSSACFRRQHRKIIIATNIAETCLTVPGSASWSTPGWRASAATRGAGPHPAPADRAGFAKQRPTSARAAAGAGERRRLHPAFFREGLYRAGRGSPSLRSSAPTSLTSSCKPRPCGSVRSNDSPSSTRRSPRPFATAIERSSNSARSMPRAN